MKYVLKSTVVPYPGMGGWHFLHIPKKESVLFKEKYGKKARGWGSIPVSVSLGKTTWKTSIFPDTQSGVYLLPLKLSARKAERVVGGDMVRFSITPMFR